MKKNDLLLTFIRIVLGVVILAHGTQKLFGWFGGFGFEGTMGFFTDTIGMPYLLGLLVIVAETLGMLALIAGLFSRVMAVVIIFLMLGAIITVHAPFGFFMNWYGMLKGEGYEFHLVVISLASVIMLQGGGAYALDSF